MNSFFQPILEGYCYPIGAVLLILLVFGIVREARESRD
jgi:hypothetical protein